MRTAARLVAVALISVLSVAVVPAQSASAANTWCCK
jgi:hypothetical protein